MWNVCRTRGEWVDYGDCQGGVNEREGMFIS